MKAMVYLPDCPFSQYQPDGSISHVLCAVDCLPAPAGVANVYTAVMYCCSSEPGSLGTDSLPVSADCAYVPEAIAVRHKTFRSIAVFLNPAHSFLP